MRLDQLENAYRILTMSEPRLAPAGPMAAYAGAQASPDDIVQAYSSMTDGLDEAPPWLPEVVRSFAVPTLVGVTGEVSADAVERQLGALLSAALPGVRVGEAETEGRAWGPIAKYGTLDAAFLAERDEATNPQMVLEIGGECVAAEGRSLRRVEGERTLVRITRAHWTNVSGLRIGGPLYL